MPVTPPTSPDPGIVGPDPTGYPMGPDPSGSLPPDPLAGILAGSMSAMAPDPYATSGPPGYSYITGTVDPTAAEIIAAAEMAGMPIPPGMDPIAFSKMMSGGPSAFPTGPPPPSVSTLPAMSAPLATPVVTPVAPPLAATPPPPTTPIPTLAPAPAPAAPMATAAPLIPIKTVVPEELTTIAPKPTDTTPKLFIEKLRAARAKSFAGIGGYSRCDPITGKCSNYA